MTLLEDRRQWSRTDPETRHPAPARCGQQAGDITVLPRGTEGPKLPGSDRPLEGSLPAAVAEAPTAASERRQAIAASVAVKRAPAWNETTVRANVHEVAVAYATRSAALDIVAQVAPPPQADAPVRPSCGGPTQGTPRRRSRPTEAATIRPISIRLSLSSCARRSRRL